MVRLAGGTLCLTVQYSTSCHVDETPISVSIGTLYKKGCGILFEYLNNRKVPEDRELRDAMMMLVTFLANEDMHIL